MLEPKSSGMDALDRLRELLEEDAQDQGELLGELRKASLWALGITEHELALEVEHEIERRHERRERRRAARPAGTPWEGPSPRHGSSAGTGAGG